MRRTERLFAIAELLRGRRTGVTAAVLAERFGVTIRTMYRDLDSLRDAALPIGAERGRGGGYALDKSYSLPPVNFTAREAALLIRAGTWLAEMRVLPFIDTLESALDKVRGALSTSSQRQLLEHLATLTFVGVPARSATAPVRRAIERAWFESLPLRIRYAGAQGETLRRIRIDTVVMERSETLINAFDLDKGERRQFRLDRIEEAIVETSGGPTAPPRA